MNHSVEVLLYGMQFRKLLEKELLEVQESHNLCKIDLQILAYLHNAGEHNTSRDIINLNLFTKGHVSQSLKRMQQQGLIILIQDKKDRRCQHIILTGSSYAIIDVINNAYKKINDIVFVGVTLEEKQFLVSIAQKINHNIQNIIIE